MLISEDIIEHLHSIFHHAHSVLLVSHKNPDGDTLGSTLGLTEVLLQRGKKCQIACIDPIPDNLKFLPNTEAVINNFDVNKYDVIIICDVAAKNMLGFSPELLENLSIPVINIDHHLSNDITADINLVYPEFASTTCIITEILTCLDWKITTRSATCLLTGIYTDTGSFMHSNTDATTLKLAAKLISKGGNVRMIRQNIFKSTKISTLRLWGRVLQNIYRNENGITVSVVTADDFQETKADFSELSGVVDYVNSVPNANFSIILTEKDGKVKGSLRTLNNDIDLSEIANRFGGGGHKKAAGFTIPGKLQKEVKWTVVN